MERPIWMVFACILGCGVLFEVIHWRGNPRRPADYRFLFVTLGCWALVKIAWDISNLSFIAASAINLVALLVFVTYAWRYFAGLLSEKNDPGA